jgi:DNA-binding response OmpR family regulator
VEVLVIEDEVRLAHALAEGLESRGFTVTLRHDGQSGYWQAKEREAEVIVLDLMLPVLSGPRQRLAERWSALRGRAADRRWASYAHKPEHPGDPLTGVLWSL